jgi:glycosyltransferase involved in cell wall biosynthesis
MDEPRRAEARPVTVTEEVRKLLVIPAYEEGPELAAMVTRARQYVHEILVVDDGSAQPLTADCTVVRHNVNQGKGAAIATGLAYARQHGYAHVAFMDGDGQHDEKYLPALFLALQTHPVVVGSRRRDWDRAMPAVRRLTNLLMTALLSWLGGVRMEDTQCGFRALRVEIIDRLPLTSRHFEAESEMLLQAAWQGLSIGWVPIPTIYAERPSHIRAWRDTCRFLAMLGRAWKAKKKTPA